MPIDDKRAANLANWEDRVPVHTGPSGYDLDDFDDPAHLSGVVRFDLPRLGRLDGLDVVHLQCHIGTDTVSLGRLGSRRVVGYDFSPSALAAGRTLASRAGAPPGSVEFVEGELEDAVEVLGPARFDLVYTGIGALCWLPSIERWAGVVAGLLRPGGRLFLREGHPMLWALDDPRPDGLLVVRFPYFETETGTRFDVATSYSGDGTALEHQVNWNWNHGLGELFTALTRAGMQVTGLEEHTSLPYNPFPDLMHPVPPLGEFALREAPERLPLSYTLQARRAG